MTDETPRTDKYDPRIQRCPTSEDALTEQFGIVTVSGPDYERLLDHARQLEREFNNMREQRDYYAAKVNGTPIPAAPSSIEPSISPELREVMYEYDAIALEAQLSHGVASNTYWMIERNSKHTNMPPTESVLWFREKLRFAQGDKDIWTPHAHKARHFATKDEAEEYVRNSLTDAELYDPAPDVTEHMDCAGPTHAEIDAPQAALLQRLWRQR